jgi:hypothetical protein
MSTFEEVLSDMAGVSTSSIVSITNDGGWAVGSPVFGITGHSLGSPADIGAAKEAAEEYLIEHSNAIRITNWFDNDFPGSNALFITSKTALT